MNKIIEQEKNRNKPKPIKFIYQMRPSELKIAHIILSELKKHPVSRQDLILRYGRGYLGRIIQYLRQFDDIYMVSGFYELVPCNHKSGMKLDLDGIPTNAERIEGKE